MIYFMGYDTKESEAFSVALHSVRCLEPDLAVTGLHLPSLREAGLYTRPTSVRDGRLWDDISQAYMSTEHANSRFLVPLLARGGGQWALFTDCDIIALRPVSGIFAEADPRYAVQVVKHQYQPKHGVKMDGQAQQLYARKNWSSVMLFNLAHPAHQRLTLDMVNGLPGRDLHRFCWLKDDEIGDLHPGWNWLVGHSSADISPRIVHYTEGLPSMAGYGECAYAENWFSMRRLWLGCGFNTIGESGDGRNIQ
jgi:hypothetical protein